MTTLSYIKNALRVEMRTLTLKILRDDQFWRFGRKSKKFKLNRPRTHPLSLKMWSGFGDRAARELEEIKLSGQLKLSKQGIPDTLTAAAWSLTQWYAYNGNYSSALDNLMLMTAAEPELNKNTNTQLMMVECLLKLGRVDEAQRWLQRASKWEKAASEIYLSAANIHHARLGRSDNTPDIDAERLACLNRIYEREGFSKIVKVDESAALTLDNITAYRPRNVDVTTKLSVLVPAYNCADTLPIAIQSILNQTWTNIEVIVVDDQSQDETWRVIERFAQADRRVVAIRHERNGGAYAARNTALAHATGDFVTVHDADDWSHPEKFAVQMLDAISNPHGTNTTVGVRTSRDLRFDVKANTGGMFIENTSSLLLRTEIIKDLGGWDLTKVGADSELYERVLSKYKITKNKLYPTTPLTLILYSPTSLTQSKATGISSIHYGARRQYKEAYRYWHAMELAKPEPDLSINTVRRFPAPRILLGEREPIRDIDVIIVGDFSDMSRSFDKDIAQWESLARAGFKLGITHWPLYASQGQDIVLPVRSTIAAGIVENIVPGQVVSCKATVLLNMEHLTSPPTPRPSISTSRLYLPAGAGNSREQEEASQLLFGCSPITEGEAYLRIAMEGLVRAS
ncbi:glycosyltransferase [Microvirga pakistanensis]|uniref:glycosyltransferase n=1 Tax=Microvirga pakistanensis TaxID=1682650 RepID=UPI001069B2EB|nr:glycosyltransferase [Microvirga pakistanensis]